MPGRVLMHEAKYMFNKGYQEGLALARQCIADEIAKERQRIAEEIAQERERADAATRQLETLKAELRARNIQL